MTTIRVRPFAELDLPACLAISNARASGHPVSLSEALADHDAWNVQRFHRSRYVAEDEGGKIVAWGEVAHSPWTFHPHKYELRLEAEPGSRPQGARELLFERLLEELRGRDAQAVRMVAVEGDAEASDFLMQRGFREVWRHLESRLELARFDPAPFVGAVERVTEQGVSLTTLPAELARGDAVLRELYELYTISDDNQQSLDPITMPPFPDFVADVVNGPQAIRDSWFLARANRRLVGLSTLERLSGNPETLEAGYTAVHPDYRARGIALALKLQTIAFAREHGYRYIQTASNATNKRMLDINQALGFQRQPAHITFELPLGKTP